MQRFFAEPHQIDEDSHRIHVTGSDVNHMKNVLRMKCGEEVWVSDGAGREYCCTVEHYEEDAAWLHILYVQEPDYELPCHISLFQAIPKGDKMDLIIQKAVELGASEIIPMETRRCVVRLDQKKAEKKVLRWQQIAESAAKQSRRLRIPKVHPVMTFGEALSYGKTFDVCLMPYELARGMKNTREILSSIPRDASVGVFIGPEGGFEEEEAAGAAAQGMKLITLGKRILRTETAGLAVLSVLMFQMEEE